MLLAVVSDTIDTNQDIVFALKFASARLRNDKGVVLAACTKYGMALEHASLELRADREAVLVAVEAAGNALQFASDELRDTKDVVLVAASKSGMALRFASIRLCQDNEVLLVACAKNGEEEHYFFNATLLTNLRCLLPSVVCCSVSLRIRLGSTICD